jgi:hypothetical protein
MEKNAKKGRATDKDVDESRVNIYEEPKKPGTMVSSIASADPKDKLGNFKNALYEIRIENTYLR